MEKKKRIKPDVFQLVKKVLTKGTIKYPELALYENFLRTSADHYLYLSDSCELIPCNTFGISVIPKTFNREFHASVSCDLIDKNTNKRIYMLMPNLPHQLYLHDILMKKWKMEAEGMAVEIRIYCVAKKMCITINPSI